MRVRIQFTIDVPGSVRNQLRHEYFEAHRDERVVLGMSAEELMRRYLAGLEQRFRARVATEEAAARKRLEASS